MRITVIGSGYVGLSTAVCLAACGHQIVCVDVLPERVASINQGQVPFYEPRMPEMLSAGLSSGRLRATGDLGEAIVSSEVTFICVGTPQAEHGIDLSAIATAARQVGAALRHTSGYHVVAVKSTVIPGTTDTLVRQMLERHSGRTVGQFGLCVNPEFLREGWAIDDFMHPDRIVIGQWDEKSGQVLTEVYRAFECPMFFTTLRNAELIKYTSNALLATLISFSNEIAALCEATPDTDVREVMRALHLDHRLSPLVNGKRIRPGILNFLWAGSGFGGSCLPKDVNALRAYGREQHVPLPLLDAVMTINANRAAYLEQLAEKALGSLSGRRITVLGLAFKPGTDDLRESPALTIIRLLLDKGAQVRGFDPLLTTTPRSLNIDARVSLCATPEYALREADAALVTTAWPEFAQWDWAQLCRLMRQPVIIDGRNVLSEVVWPPATRYWSIGRVVENGT